MERGEIQRKRRTYCVAGAPNDISYTNNIHIPSISVHYFPKDIAVWPKWMRFDRCHRGDFTLHCQCLMLRTGFEDGCYEHIPQVKSGEDNQWIQLKQYRWRGLFPHRTRLFDILFGWHFASEEWWSPYCCLFHALEMYLYSLSFHMTAFALFLSYENRTNCSFHRILITELYQVQAFSWAVRSVLFREQSETSGWCWHKQARSGCIFS